jgi:RP/EB family microtubule-associated protein
MSTSLCEVRVVYRCLLSLERTHSPHNNSISLAKYQDNLEFMQWFKAFYDQSGAFRDDYDAAAVRAKGKGGAAYNREKSRSRATMGSTTRPAPSVSRPASTARPIPASRPATTRPIVAVRPAAPLSKAPIQSPPALSTAQRQNHQNLRQVADTDNKQQNRVDTLNVELTQKNSDLHGKVEELELLVQERTAKVEEVETSLLEIEKERDFYFEKLRNIEVMLQVHQEKEGESDPNHLVDKIFKVLYATVDDVLVVNDEGEVVDAGDLSAEELDAVSSPGE